VNLSPSNVSHRQLWCRRTSLCDRGRGVHQVHQVFIQHCLVLLGASEDAHRIVNRHENNESVHETSTTYEHSLFSCYVVRRTGA
jgi:hypothetical protein